MTTRTLTLFTAGTALALAIGCSSAHEQVAAPGPTVTVQTATAAVQPVDVPFVAGGVVKAKTVAVISSHIMAAVTAVHAAPGDRVKAGQVLVVLDGRDLKANRSRAAAGEGALKQGILMAEADRQAAAAGFELASATHKRFADLRAKNSATQNELDQAVAGLRAAESRLKAAEARIAAAKLENEAASAGVSAADTMAGWSTIVAPFDGIVTEKEVEVGNMVGPGQPVITVEDVSAFRLEARVDESRATLVRVGDAAQAALVVPGQTTESKIDATVAEVARMFSPESHDYVVKLSLPKDVALRSGIYGRVRFSGPMHDALTVPAAAIVVRGQLKFVFVVAADSKARLRLVDVAEPVGASVEVRAGLQAGDRVVLAPPASLTDGANVSTGGR